MRLDSSPKKENMRKVRLSQKTRRWITFALVFFFLFGIYWYLNRRGLRWYAWPYKWDAKFTKLECVRPKVHLDGLVDIARATYTTFDELGVTAFPIYGTLFGALRYRGPVPWDEDVDMGVVGSELDKYSFSQLQAAFAKHGIAIRYYSWGGLYKLKSGKSGAEADVMPFYNVYGGAWMYRNGWEAYILFLNYWYNHVFPKRLLTPPLPKIEFGGMMMNMTHGGYKIQTYHFKEDWFREVRPPQCEGSKFVPKQAKPVIVTSAPENPKDALYDFSF